METGVRQVDASRPRYEHAFKAGRFRVNLTQNLRVEGHRAELPQMERDRLVAEWCRLVGKPISSQVETKRGRPESGINEASRQLGLERNDVHRAIKVASITPEAQQAAHEVGNRWATKSKQLLAVASRWVQLVGIWWTSLIPARQIVSRKIS